MLIPKSVLDPFGVTGIPKPDIRKVALEVARAYVRSEMRKLAEVQPMNVDFPEIPWGPGFTFGSRNDDADS